MSVAALRGGHSRRTPPSTDQFFLNFMQFFGTLGRVGAPSYGNPGSAPACYTFPEITSGATFADLLAVGMVAKLVSSTYL